MLQEDASDGSSTADKVRIWKPSAGELADFVKVVISVFIKIE